jgi:TolA-binding protein
MLAGCLPVWKADEMQQRIDSLEARQEVMQKNVKEQEEELEKMVQDARQDVKRLKEVLEEARKLLQRNNADLGAEMQEVRQEVQRLRGQVETAQFQVKRLEQELRLFKEDVDLRFAGENKVSELPEKPEDLLEAGREKLEAGDYGQARRAFEEFLDRHSGHKLADEAQFLKAKSLGDKGEWRSAIFEFKKVLDQYPNSARRGGATYFIGIGFTELGRCEQAKPFFETVVDEHGDSEYASGASKEVKAIEAGRCP